MADAECSVDRTCANWMGPPFCRRISAIGLDPSLSASPRPYLLEGQTLYAQQFVYCPWACGNKACARPAQWRLQTLKRAAPQRSAHNRGRSRKVCARCGEACAELRSRVVTFRRLFRAVKIARGGGVFAYAGGEELGPGGMRCAKL